MSKYNLIKAKKAKNDEFYTQLSDIEKELSHYPIETFQDKIIYCPCDSTDYSNGYISNFSLYFYKNFKSLGLKKLICTCYSDGINYYEYNGINEFEYHRGSGDFRSKYCTELLRESDIVVTNPPFSLFRDFIGWLKPYIDTKNFIIVGNKNALTYKEIFPLIKDNKLWMGVTSPKDFIQPDSDEKKSMAGLTRWFTNCNYNKRHEELILVESYDSEKYPKYDNYDAIEVSKTKNIPKDYDGVMGVPITFIDSYNPDQFEIIRFRKGDDDKDLCVNGKCPYFRILIRHRKDENGRLI